MYEFTHAVILYFGLAAAISVGIDLATYEKRQTAWEKAHPGSTYIRHYKRRQRKGLPVEGL